MQKGDVIFSCENGRWVNADKFGRNVYGESCEEDDVGKLITGHEIDTLPFQWTETINHYCSLNGWVDIRYWNWDVPKEVLQKSSGYGTLVDKRDGQVYKTTSSDGTGWMAENLNYADSVSTPSLLGNSWCYADKEANCKVGGRLYTWAAAIDSVALAEDENNPIKKCKGDTTCLYSIKIRGICPEGWRLPNYNDFKAFTWYSSTIKTVNGWGRGDDGNRSSDDINFSALPTGYRNVDGKFAGAGSSVSYWASSPRGDTLAYSYGIKSHDYYGYFNFGSSYKNSAKAIRCVRD